MDEKELEMFCKIYRVLENDINGIIEWWQRNILNGWLKFFNGIENMNMKIQYWLVRDMTAKICIDC